MSALDHRGPNPVRTGLIRHGDAVLQAEVRRLALAWTTVVAMDLRPKLPRSRRPSLRSADVHRSGSA